MRYLHRRGNALIFAAGMLFCGLAVAGLTEGINALVAGDYFTALRELRPLAEGGNPEAQYRLGRMYEFGRGVPVDMQQAIEWLGRSAAQGNVAAELELGVIYATGDGGVKEDDARAVEWFQRAAARGNATAQYNLGVMYAKGAGVPKDLAQSVVWLRKAAEQGDAGAQFELGVAYEKGEGVAKDDVLAYACYAIAARGGDKETITRRDAAGARLSPLQLSQANALAADWKVGKPMPGASAAPK